MKSASEVRESINLSDPPYRTYRMIVKNPQDIGNHFKPIEIELVEDPAGCLVITDGRIYQISRWDQPAILL